MGEFSRRNGVIWMINVRQFSEWIERLPDEDVDGFEDAVHAAGAAFAESEHDGMMRNCISGFYGDNPAAWAEDSAQSIASNCKGVTEAHRIVVAIVSDALARLGREAPVVSD